MQSLAPIVTEETPGDAAGVEALVDLAFGPGRFAKAAERLREGNAPLLALSRVARSAAALVGCARAWPIAVGEAPALLLGPVAVDPAFRGRGLGARLVADACEAASLAGHRHVLLVGDLAYFAPLGFAVEPARAVRMPGPVDRRRLLLKVSGDGEAPPIAGLARAARPIASGLARCEDTLGADPIRHAP